MEILEPVEVGGKTWKRTKLSEIEWNETHGYSFHEERPLYRNRPPTSCPVKFIPETLERIIYHNPT